MKPDSKNKSVFFRQFIYPIIIFIVALTIRLLYLNVYKQSPLFYAPQIDAKAYLETAEQMAEGSFWNENQNPFYQPPFYPFLLSLGIKIFGNKLFLLHLLQFMLGAVNCVLIYYICLQLCRPAIALIAGLIASLYWPLIYFDGEFLTVTWMLFFNLMSLIYAHFYHKKKKKRYLVITGFLIGLSAITRPTILLFGWLILPFYLLQFSFRQFKSSFNKRKIRLLLVYLLFTLIPILPVTLYNYSCDQSLLLVSSNGGLNFYIGNSPESLNAEQIRTGEKWMWLTSLPQQEKGILQKESDASRFFTQKGLQYIMQHPNKFILNKLKNLLRIIHHFEIPRNLDLNFQKTDTRLFQSLPLFSYRIVAILFFSTLIFLLPQRNSMIRLLLGFTFTGLLVVGLFYVSSRFRMVFVASMLISGIYGVLFVIRNMKNRKILIQFSVSALIAISLINFDLFGVQKQQKQQTIVSENLFFKARAYEALSKTENPPLSGDLLEKAILTHKRSIDTNPANTDPYLDLATIYFELGLKAAGLDNKTGRIRKKQAADRTRTFHSLETAQHYNRKAYSINKSRQLPRFNICLLNTWQNYFESFSAEPNITRMIKRAKITEAFYRQLRHVPYPFFNTAELERIYRNSEKIRKSIINK